MNICVISPKACCKSARELAEALGAKYSNPYNDRRVDYTEFDGIFNYGCSTDGLKYKNILNTVQAVKICVDKLLTFKHFKAHQIASPAFVTHPGYVPKDWGHVVARSTLVGRANEGMTVVDPSVEPIPNGVLFTEYFYHDWEYRIVVFRGQVVGRYRKEQYVDEKGKEVWDFILLEPAGMKAMDKECIKAAESVGMDYVGFDVVENDKGEFVILEANSGPILMDEVKAAIIKAFKGQ